PRQYHMAFTEAHDERSLRTAAWLFPLFLLLLNLTIPIILWAGRAEYPTGDPDSYVLTITLHGGSPWMPVFIFLGGVSAASAMVIVSVLALASMSLNHLILRRRRAAVETDLYAFLRWTRRLLVVAILLSAYGLFLIIGESQRLVELGLVSFVAVAQFLPGLAGVLFWRRATGRAVVAGLGVGIAGWLLFAVAPLLVRSQYLHVAFDLPVLIGVPPLHSLSFATFVSLGANALVMSWLSLRRAPSAEEAAMARVCIDAGEPLPTGRLEVESPDDFTRALAPVLGIDVAAREVARALADTELAADETHPAELRRLRDQLQRNLSGLLGPLAAEGIVDAGLRLDQGARSVGEKMRALESLVSTSSQDLAAELDQVRRYLRDVLEDLPVGVCAIGPDEDVVLWNRALTEITGVPDIVTGSAIARVPAPWGPILDAFARDPAEARKLTAPRADGEDGRFHMRKSRLTRASGEVPAGHVILVEDRTERASLEAKLEHHERLALIGQLAASVAHEIGNPLAAIASIAQNLMSEQRDGDVRQRLQLIRDQVERIGGIVKAMVVYSRAGTSAALSPASRFSLGEAVDEAVSLVRLDKRGRVHAIHNRCSRDLHLYGDRTRIIQVFINLLHNACDASPAEEAIEVRAKAGADHALIEIVDHGAGVAAEVRDRIFEPFFTTKEPGKGTGLGLSLVYNIVRDHAGTLEVESRSGEGTTIRLSLPLEAA
ncbi:MAG TPA: ATP-binding protein, partial [Kofleriaceae bacterium]|nr:ATP-binding protein [Kofleriaceae bacterium]